ncbi:unnamed protein product [Didymodactylos carnosus]|uniref:BED-type domain-containing protein n=1 Tax=Didymodactylos carnosus TaxID=1234261 RepID=A0A815W2Q6_9BILA|nr:unnamed protein product [Didymodactylos carnosus]CAF1538165.1 unnamed protein product [Didymodactylos carnosus]CAF4102155.1 unnamed protein product [Didymodactylos carnosus]CAF4398195.1 unnamed protein product [Didymodactylos carnosus]
MVNTRLTSKKQTTVILSSSVTDKNVHTTNTLVLPNDNNLGSSRISSKVWNYFTRSDNVKVLQAECNLCHVRIKTKNWNTSTLLRHLTGVHKIDHLSDTAAIDRKCRNKLPLLKQRRLNAVAIEAIIQDGRTFNDFNKPGIQRFFQEALPGFIPPSRHNVKRRLKRLHIQAAATLIKTLEIIDHIAITLDFWTDRKMSSYMVLTGHYINERFKLNSCILRFSKFDHRHFSPNIDTEIEKQLKELHIFDKITTITCDGASNLIGAFRYFSRDDIQRIQCMAHKLHLVVCNGLGLWIKRKVSNCDLDNGGDNADEMLSDDEMETDEERLSQTLEKISLNGTDNPLDDLSDEELYAYFDLLGFYSMTNLERTAVEQIIKEIYQNKIGNTQYQQQLPQGSSALNRKPRITLTNEKTELPLTPMNYFLKLVGKDLFRNTKTKSNTLEEEMKSYRTTAVRTALEIMSNNKTDKNPLLFWQKNVLTMPLLAKMSKLYLATPGTSVSSESAFSLSAYYGRKERSRLQSETLALSVFLKDKLQQQEDTTN